MFIICLIRKTGLIYDKCLQKSLDETGALHPDAQNADSVPPLFGYVYFYIGQCRPAFESLTVTIKVVPPHF